MMMEVVASGDTACTMPSPDVSMRSSSASVDTRSDFGEKVSSVKLPIVDVSRSTGRAVRLDVS